MSVLYIKDKDGKFIAVQMLKGEDGKSSYQIALDNGFEGTEEEWLKSLKGSDYILTDIDKQDIAQIVGTEYVDSLVGDIETTLDSIIAIQENLIGEVTK